MDTAFAIRLMREEDLPEVEALDRLAFRTPWPPGAFARELRNPSTRIWVAEHQAESPRIVGVLVLWLVLDEGHIAILAVHPAVRRRGLGRRLMETAIAYARQEGLRTLTLEVRESNQAAQALYRKLGFEVVGRRYRYYLDTGEDALIMTLRLPQVPAQGGAA